MAIFSNPEAFKEHKQYVALLKKALLVVKPGVEKKFLYFKQYPPFGGKKPPLVLVDYDSNCVAALAKAGHKPAAEGLATLTEQDELNFEANKGTLKRIRLKKYFATMGSGIKPVFVPAGEVDEEEGAPSESDAPVAESSVVATAPATAIADPPEPLPTPAPAADPDAPRRQALLARIKELQGMPCPPDVEALRKSALDKARALLTENRFTDVDQLLAGLAAKLSGSSRPVAPPAGEPKPAAASPAASLKAPAPTLSAYMNATAQWNAARKTAEDGVFKLKSAILSSCDPELKDIVKAKVNDLNSILAVLDDTILKKIEEARGDGDDERRAEREAAIGQLASTKLASLRQHPLAAVVDNNPFGTFTIRAPMEQFLSQIAGTFGR
ncbi:MAG: hypothetical protein U1F83_09710 [Verrucomicrobiota bacterium]